MPVLERAALQASPLADLHAIASEMRIDGYRRLRKAALVDALLERAGVDAEAVEAVDAEALEESEEVTAPADGGERDGEPAEAFGAAGSDETVAAADADEEADADEAAAPEEAAGAAGAGDATEAPEADDATDAGVAALSAGEVTRRRRGRRGGRGRGAAREDGASAGAEPAPAPEPEIAEWSRLRTGAEAEVQAEAEVEPTVEAQDVLVEGVVELLANGSGFVRSTPGETSDEDVYVSATQVKRCELVNGDRIAGPKRAPRRSERFASLVRVDTINGRPAAEIADSARYDELPLAFPSERIVFDSEDPTLRAIDMLTPIGRGSRVTITGGARSGKTELLRRIVHALAERDDTQLLVALAGVRPEEISEWSAGPAKPAAAVSFAVSADTQEQAVEIVVDQARRIAARGGNAIIAIDSLDGLHAANARKLLAAARKIVDGGSLTLIATASAPLGGETTVIALNAALTSAGRFPALDVARSGTIRAELLVGEDGARAIAEAHAEA